MNSLLAKVITTIHKLKANRHVIIQRLMLGLLGVGGGLLLVEVGLHLFPSLLPPVVRQALAIYTDFHQTSDLNRPFSVDRELIYVPRPNVDLEIHDGLTLQYTVRTRSLGDPGIGFRDIGAIRPTYAVAVGDSFTWGTYVEAEQTWPEQLQAEVGAPIINLGVLGYGPIQYQIITQKYGLPLEPRLVLWGIFSGNDFVNSTDYVQWEQAGKPDTWLKKPEPGVFEWLSRHVRLYELLKFSLHAGIYYQRLASPEVVRVPALGGPDWAFYPDILERQAASRRPEVAAGWQLTQQALLTTAANVQAAGATFVVVIIPPKELIYWDILRPRLADPTGYDLTEPIRTLMEFCAAQKFLCLDLTPAFAEQTRAGQELYFRQDAHLNPAGYHLAAQLIAAYLNQRKLSPLVR